MSTVLVVNSGSSSFKYQLIEMDGETTLASGLVERIGDAEGRAKHTVFAPAATAGEGAATFTEATYKRRLPIPDHTAGFRVMLEAFAENGPALDAHPPVAVGHRVVHGGARFFEPTLVTPLVEINIDELSVLAPLHNPANLAGIVAAKKAFPAVPHVAVFDTAFHQTLSPAAYTYAIDAKLAADHRIRRYGFHGTSHKFVSEAAAAFVGRPVAELKQLVFHLGNGASVTAIDGGRSVETSMGFTPLEGLVMGTRSGDLDPAILFHLARREGMSIADLDALLNKRSGLLGMAGSNDLRDIRAAIEKGDASAVLAYEVYVHRLRQYAGAYLAHLGGADVISFTAGVGENAPHVRAAALETLAFAGVEIDAERNHAVGRGAPGADGGIHVISTDESRVIVLVVPTDEELEIARQTLSVASA
ncbi:acetate kinase [Microbacterium terrae]|uniref:Acetate kinase n=1 Tax=Microbacterium terrae TaxID=69369 RepID=A0A0M2H194_9MICO|nr:acetate kinase [Microbacterium terrae]KJL37760.1 Acetate kinase [Microbacterium terrae]MBP1076592.1 acetate kinase [Microbacterium terrae]GLJ97420.1 acetate kinase [Microbacterium terrae]